MVAKKTVVYMLLLLFSMRIRRTLQQQQLSCDERNTCGSCMADDGCYWCLDDLDDVSFSPRCISKLQEDSDCGRKYDPKGQVQMVSNLPLNPDASTGIVQVSPQKVKVEVRPLDPGGQVLYYFLRHFEITHSTFQSIKYYFSFNVVLDS